MQGMCFTHPSVPRSTFSKILVHFQRVLTSRRQRNYVERKELREKKLKNYITTNRKDETCVVQNNTGSVALTDGATGQLSLKSTCIALSTHIHIAQSKGPSKGAVGKVQCQGLAGHGLSSLSWLAVAFFRGGPERARFGSSSPPFLITALPGNQRVQSQSNSWWGPNCKLILSELCKQITLILPCIYFSLVHMETQPSLKIPYHLLYPRALWSWCPLLIPAVANSCVRQRLWEIPVGQNKLWDVIRQFWGKALQMENTGSSRWICVCHSV